MQPSLRKDLEIIVEKTPEEWAALAKKIRSQPVEQPELNLFDLKTAAKAAGDVGMVVAGAAAVIYAGYKIYQQYMSKAAKACRGNPDKKACMIKFEIRAKKAEIDKMTNEKSVKCKSGDCYAKVDLKIRQRKREILELKKKLKSIPPPKRPESERREDEIFKGHHPAVK